VASGRLVLAAAIAAAAAGAASAQSEIRKDFDAVTVTARAVEATMPLFGAGCDPVPGWCAQSVDLRVRFTFKAAEPVETTIPNYVGDVRPDAVSIRGQRLMIAGSDELSVFDARTAAFVDRIAGFRMSMSPGGRYQAYVRVSSSRQRWSDDVYLVYDLDVDPTANRMQEALPDLPNRAVAATSAGIAVYPTENSEAATYYAEPAASNAHRSISPLLWISDHELVFADRAREHNTIVLVDLAGGPSRPRVQRTPLDEGQLAGRFEVGQLSLVDRDAGSIRLSLEPAPAGTAAAVIVKIPIG